MRESFRRFLVVLLLALVSGCASGPAPAPAGGKPVFVHVSRDTTDTTLLIQDEEVVVEVATEAPPAPKVEVINFELRPGGTYVWVHGHWAWRDGRWVWLEGRWVPRRAGRVYVAGHWERIEDRYRWVVGTWIVEEEQLEETPGQVDCDGAPPAAIVEVVHNELRPSERHVWIPGHWAWYGHWVWVHGHWHLGRSGQLWLKGHWVARDGRWHWEAGRWVVEAQVTEERPGELVATVTPPAPYQETILIETRPAPNYVWIHGHWAWHGHWVWEHGHWHPGRSGFTFRNGHWVEREGRWQWVAGAWVQDAQVVAETTGLVEATSAPPAPCEETILIETRPAANYVWIHGHWAWHGHWVWEHGHWQPGRANQTWVQGRWALVEGHWRWSEGSWIEETKIVEERPGLLEATVEPPAPYHETIVIETRPARNYVWIDGHWAWHGHWVWEHGHWQPGREGRRWEAGRWEARNGRWFWVGGAWR
jgi:hypothetical protein